MAESLWTRTRPPLMHLDGARAGERAAGSAGETRRTALNVPKTTPKPPYRLKAIDRFSALGLGGSAGLVPGLL
jgi:hypothetical protein